MRKIDTAQRRARLGRRHHLGAPAANVVNVAGDLVGLHASDPQTVYLAALARVHGFVHEDLESALYEDRTLLRMLGMRRTMFVVPHDIAAVMDAACTKALEEKERRRLIGMLDGQGIADDAAAWLDDVEERVVAALGRMGGATATELRSEIPELTGTITYGEGKKWGGEFGVSTRVLFLLATAARIVRGRPRGTWLSSLYEWQRVEDWIGAPLPELDARRARAELVRRWLASFGPGSFTDVKWWTGWTVRDTKEALADVGAVEVGLENGTGLVLPEDAEVVEEETPWVALLPGLDPTTMGWKERGWYLADDHVAVLFDRNGNAGPTVWWNGRVVGGWSQRPDGEVAYRLLEKVPPDVVGAVEREAEHLSEWLGEVRVKPRFATPLDKELRK